MSSSVGGGDGNASGSGSSGSCLIAAKKSTGNGKNLLVPDNIFAARAILRSL